MRKMTLHYQCPNCEKESQFKTNDLPAGFISPDDLNENRVSVLDVECPICTWNYVATREEVKKALAIPRTRAKPDPPKGKKGWFWK